ncbi:MAG: M48 family metallopeptidase [Candidatus Omnitrophica bacterium]|nr:M48 family metallopeptidase [Candidatus Omnitrophota bacterium]
MYLIIILVFIVGDYILNSAVEIFNVRAIKTNLPEEFLGYYSPDNYKKSQSYLKDNTYFKIVHSSVKTIGLLLFIFSGAFNFIDKIARSFNLGDIFSGLIFVGILFLISQVIDIPFSYYHTFIIEEKYGFNRTTLKTFILDIFKSWILTLIIGGVVISAVIWFFIRMHYWAWLWCWAGVSLFEVFLIFIAPVIIMPIFYKFTPLENGKLKEEIEKYALSQNFKLKGIFKMDSSRRSNKSNAFFTGLGRHRRIVLFDTLLKKHTTEELIAILAHETGHFKKKHNLKLMIIAIITNGLMFFTLSLFINNSYIITSLIKCQQFFYFILLSRLGLQ